MAGESMHVGTITVDEQCQLSVDCRHAPDDAA